MNRPKQTRKLITVKPLGTVPARTIANHHRRFRQPPGYFAQLRNPNHHHPRRNQLAMAA